MDDSTVVKIAAIAALTAIEVANLLTAQYDGALLLTIGSIIGGLAGYEIGRLRRNGTGGRGRG